MKNFGKNYSLPVVPLKDFSTIKVYLRSDQIETFRNEEAIINKMESY